MNRRVLLLLSALAVLVVVAWVFSTDALTPTETADASVAASPDVGLKVYIDPNTGEFVDAPTEPEAVSPPSFGDLNLSDEGLVEEDSPVSGKMVNLQGRFRHNFTAVIGPDGKPIAVCDLPKSTHNNTSDSEEE